MASMVDMPCCHPGNQRGPDKQGAHARIGALESRASYHTQILSRGLLAHAARISTSSTPWRLRRPGDVVYLNSPVAGSAVHSQKSQEHVKQLKAR